MAAEDSNEKDFRYVLRIVGDDPLPVRSFFLAPGEHVVGSLEESQVHLPHPGVSRRHALLEVLSSGGVILADLGSKNGTVLAGRRVTKAIVVQPVVVGFGPLTAELQPVGLHSGQLTIELPATHAGTGDGAPAVAIDGPSTTEDTLVERLVLDLQEATHAADTGGSNPAVELARRWLGTTGAERMELARTAGTAEALLAVADLRPGDPGRPADLEAAGGRGLVLRVWHRDPHQLRHLRPLAEVALRCLESPAGPIASISEPVSTTVLPLPPPGSLNPAVKRLYRSLAKVAAGDIPVLVLGESGAGKEVMARWLHDASPRAGEAFLALNCAALPKDLLEAELFGIERGVATGVEARPGILERATGGTILLDEVGDMALETQAKLLRVLENRSVFRVGGREPVRANVRFVAATNQPLDRLVEDGRFRRDLLHRLAAFVAELPPLRDRREDIPLLAAHFFQRECERSSRSSPGITRAALGALVNHPWPGNVRQLANEVARAVLLLDSGEPLDLVHLSAPIRAYAGGPAGAAPLSLRETIEAAERTAYRTAVSAAGGDHRRAIDLLGISRATFYRKLKELGIEETASGD